MRTDTRLRTSSCALLMTCATAATLVGGAANAAPRLMRGAETQPAGLQAFGTRVASLEPSRAERPGAPPAVNAPRGAGTAGLQATRQLQFFTISGVLARHDRGAGAPAPVREAALHRTDRRDDATPARAVPLEPFGLVGFLLPGGTLVIKWTQAKAELEADRRAAGACRAAGEGCTPAMERYLALAGELRGLEGIARLERANAAVNAAVRYQSDLAHHGVIDRWSGPLATLGQSGDCEDYAIAKFALLRDAGMPESELRIVLLRDTAIRQDHAVLAARTPDGWRILDNRRAAVVMDSALPDYLALASLDESGVKLLAAHFAAAETTPGDASGPRALDFDISPAARPATDD